MQRSLRARVTFALAAITVALAVVAGSAMVSLTRLGGAIDTILRENYRSVVACDAMNEALERLDSAALLASTGRDDIARTMLEQHRARFQTAFRVEASNITLAAEGAAVHALEARYRAYVTAVDEALASPEPGRRATYLRELLPRFAGVKAAVLAVRHMNQAAMEAADRDARALARRSTLTTLALVAAALALALWVAWRVPSGIVRPIRALSDAAKAIGDGELDVVIEDPEVRELAPLVESFQKMLTRLRAYRASSLGELRAAQDLADATVRCLVDPVVVCGEGDAVLLANEAAVRTFGLRADAEGAPSRDASLPEAFARARDEVLAAGRPVTPRNLSEAMRWRDRGGDRYFLVRAAPLRGDGATLRGAVVVAQDVTRLRRIDELKSDMVATVSHEFKTPLTSLRMATHLLLEPSAGALTDTQREIVTSARDDTERLRALVDELLDLVRIETEAGDLRRTAVQPRRLLLSAIEMHRAIARDKGVSLDLTEPGALPDVELDVEKISIVLANIVSNAIRHTPAGGSVTLGAACDERALSISIVDTGEGVAVDELARMLDSETARQRPTQSGGWRHGLGMSIAREIVLQHGGELRVQSAPGAGSTFTVTIPRDAA
ncbi:MAG: ATP-binding protein [Polyangiales bacterium]